MVLLNMYWELIGRSILLDSIFFYLDVIDINNFKIIKNSKYSKIFRK